MHEHKTEGKLFSPNSIYIYIYIYILCMLYMCVCACNVGIDTIVYHGSLSVYAVPAYSSVYSDQRVHRAEERSTCDVLQSGLNSIIILY